MRELFDEGAGTAPVDGQEAVRRAARAPQLKKFYAHVAIEQRAANYLVTLDGKVVRTRGRRELAAPRPDIAETIAAEWRAQGEFIEPVTMPMTRLANSVLDGVIDGIDEVAVDARAYFASDHLFYRASHPEGLVAQEAALWDPVLFWTAETFGAHFILTQGVTHVRQPDAALAAVRAAMPARAWELAAFHVVTTLTGSALLALALTNGFYTPDQVWAAAHVDEDWNAARWGSDAEETARRTARHRDFVAAAQILGRPASG